MRRAGRGRLLPVALLALAAVLATGQLVRALAGRTDPDAAFASEKLDFWRRHAQRFDVLVYGTSRVFRGIDPRALDAEAARLGWRASSFNASQPGVGAAEQRWVLERFLDAAPDDLAWAVVEPTARVDLHYANVTTEAVVAAHDLRGTLDVLRLTWAARIPARDRLSFAANHALALSYHLAGAGTLAAALRPRPQDAAGGDLERHLGFASLDRVPGEHRPRRAAFEMLLAAERAGTLEREPERPDARLTPAAIRHFRALAARVEAHARLAWLIMPNYGASRSQAFRNSHANGDLPGLLVDLDDPSRNPDARNPELFWDRRHLNERGARAASVRLARQLSAARGAGP